MPKLLSETWERSDVELPELEESFSSDVITKEGVVSRPSRAIHLGLSTWAQIIGATQRDQLIVKKARVTPYFTSVISGELDHRSVQLEDEQSDAGTWTRPVEEIRTNFPFTR